MTARVSEKLLNRVIEGLIDSQDNTNPFVKENNETFIKFDRISIDKWDQELITAKFFWKGDLAFAINVQCDFSNQILDLCDIEGKIKVKVISS